MVPRIHCFSGSLSRYSFHFISLRTLYLSLRFFSRSDPLFSIVCALFDKKPGGMGTSATPQRSLRLFTPSLEGRAIIALRFSKPLFS